MRIDEKTTRPPAVPTRRRRRIRSVLRSSFVRYLAVGGASFAVDAGLLLALHEGAGWPRIVATSVGFWSALLMNFTLNRLWAFGGHEDVKVSLVRYLTLVGFNYVGTVAIVEVGTRLGAALIVAKAFATGLTVFWNFIAYRFWVFR
ncbi:MAG TPA: GtrA family protein [Mycobacteriales bacterium]|nr:GtrA family protein [Mycobacteriales bacterium]